MLNEEVARYEMLTGESAKGVPISRIGGFLDGFDKAEAVHKQAIERQVPKKPIDNFFDKRCPSCNSIWGITKNEKFCPNCGQAIEWDESR